MFNWSIPVILIVNHSKTQQAQKILTLTSLKDMLVISQSNLFLPQRAEKAIAKDLNWWSKLIQSDNE